MRPLDLLFPPRCAGCARGRWPFCAACQAELEALVPPWCRGCGLPAEREVERCTRCPPPPITRARAPFRYSGPARAAVHRLKFAGWRSIADALGAAMATTVSPADADAVTWVPLSPARLATRGYDQARALARPVGTRLDLPVVRLLRRVRDTGPQARRDAGDRRAAMAGAFRVVGRSVPARVLLVDDVLTTGATASSCAEALVRAGARSVVLVTAARAVPRAPACRYTWVGSHPRLWLPGETPR